MSVAYRAVCNTPLRVCVRRPGDGFNGARLTPVRPEFRTEFHRNFRQARHEESPERHVQLASRDTSAVNRYDAFKLSKYLGGSNELEPKLQEKRSGRTDGPDGIRFL